MRFDSSSVLPSRDVSEGTPEIIAPRNLLFKLLTTRSTMATPRTTALGRLRLFSRCTCPRYIRPSSQIKRNFHYSAPQRTDGVFRELTAMRIRTPWVEALRKQQAEGSDPTSPSGKQQVPSDRKLEPKRMSDSYHKVILPLAQDPWLLDTYLNASGHIRLGTIFMDLDALSGVIA
jgi:acyl-coenzyme A thioesterase 9